MELVSGKLLTSDGFIDAHVEFENGVVKHVGDGPAIGATAEGVIVPTFINSHTHIADFVVPVDTRLSLEELVAPPHGLKHRMLSSISAMDLTCSMVYLSKFMFSRGISSYIDFREGGVEGAKALASARGNGAEPVIMARPSGLKYVPEEIDALLEVADGVAVSSITDWDYGELKSLAMHVKEKNGRFAIHASERIREDIGRVLDLDPWFVVHMTVATKDDVAECAQADVPIVVCPRSNLFFGSVPPLKMMLDTGANIALGTDNAMVSMPDMFQEIEMAARLLRSQGMRDLTPLIDMAFANARILLNRNDSFNIQPGTPCDFMVLRSKGGDPLTDLALRSSPDDPSIVCHGKHIWRK
ncbi:MAG: amidohydrolase family protein [Methanomassiliicoccales archaeon]